MSDAIAAQQAALLTLYTRHVAPGQGYALVDFPDHANVGDSAIWLGETRMLRQVTGREPDYVCTWADFDEAAFRRTCPDGVLFLHGGGNLGDIWIHHQTFRERLIDRIRDRPVVQLPQSIHFRDPARMARFATAVAAHPDFHLYVRDRQSLALGQELACRVTLAPDSAFALGARHRHAPDCAVLMLLRTDDERRAEDRSALAALPGAVILDWLTGDAVPSPDRDESRSVTFDRAAAARVERGLQLVSRGERFVTDRLHGHILATLLGVPHVALDNDYGKIAVYVDCWTRGHDGVATAGSVAEAVAWLAAAR